MEYEDDYIKTTWKNDVLRIRIRNLKDNTIDLLRIIFEAAVEHDHFNLAVDAREMTSLSWRQMWDLTNFAIEMKPKINQYTGKLSILTTAKYHKYINFVMRHAGPTCPYYITENARDAKNFVN